MRELSLNVLDIVQNSLVAGATLVEISLEIDFDKDMFTIGIKDNGSGIDEDKLARVCDPFYTTRSTRRVGLGLSLFKYEAENSGGSFEISSKKGEGTNVRASFCISSIDRLPLGNLCETLLTLIQTNEQVDFIMRASSKGEEGLIDTREFRAVLDGIPLSSPEVKEFIKSYYEENITSLYGGKL